MPIYLDHNATSPVRPEVLEAMLPFLKSEFGNPSSLHQSGQRARKAVEEARTKIARFIHADSPDEIVFTSGGTEANNMALKGAAFGNITRGKHLITSAIEHASVRHALHFLRDADLFTVTEVGVTPAGAVKVREIENLISAKTTLVSVMAVNNETGVIQPVEEIGKLVKLKRILFHIDAVQAAGRMKIDVNAWNADLLTLSGHKLGAPKGVGVLYIRKGTRMEALIHGGSQEKNRRGGTENVAAIVGLGEAADIARENWERQSSRMGHLRNLLESELLTNVTEVSVNGGGADRVSNTLNMCFEFTDSSQMLMALDLKGISVSNGSACASGNPTPSHVLTAMGLPQEKAHACLRFSLGPANTEQEIRLAAKMIIETVAEARAAHPLWRDRARV